MLRRRMQICPSRKRTNQRSAASFSKYLVAEMFRAQSMVHRNMGESRKITTLSYLTLHKRISQGTVTQGSKDTIHASKVLYHESSIVFLFHARKSPHLILAPNPTPSITTTEEELGIKPNAHPNPSMIPYLDKTYVQYKQHPRYVSLQ